MVDNKETIMPESTVEKQGEPRKAVLWKDDVISDVFTIPNAISLVRLILIPIFFYLLINENNVPATILYAIAASTDWVDGFIARRTHTVSKVGTILDPAVDRLLMVFAVIGLAIVDRLPIWIVVLIFLRDLVMFIGYFVLYKHYKVRIDVVLAGKIATTLLYIGLGGLILNRTHFPGLGIVDVPWLPGFNSLDYSWGIWFVYLGLILGIFTTSYYALLGILASQKQESAEAK